MPINDPVMMLGLFPNVGRFEIESWLEQGNQVWTLNDFYMLYPWLFPTAIWQVHPPHLIQPVYEANRWLGNWRAVYEESKATIYTCHDDVGCKYKQHVLSDDELLPSHNYHNTINYMLAYAQLIGVTHVEIRGVHMIDNLEERNYQIRSMVDSITLLREQGAYVETQRFCDKSYFEHWDEQAPHDIPLQVPYHKRGMTIDSIPPPPAAPIHSEI